MFENPIETNYESKLLFVDDDRLVRRAFERDVIRGSHHQLTVASCAEEGLEALGSGQYGVVLTDYNMPGMNGLDFLEKVRGLTPDSMRILVTGRADLGTCLEVINTVGLFSMVLKPWDPSELRAIISRAARQHQLTIENQLLTSELAEKVGELGKLNSNLEKEVHRRTTSLLTGLITALDLRDTETQSHSRRVAVYARRLAQKLGLAEPTVLDVAHGALLHDVGKIGVSDTILLKPGKLTDEEWVEMRKHAVHGYQILSGIEFLGDARQIVLEHHERWDGKGYPQGLGGKQIHIGARIFAVIDTYDAMTSDRPYRKALSHEIASEEILKNSGTQFDPSVVDAWLDLSKEEVATLRESINFSDRDSFMN